MMREQATYLIEKVGKYLRPDEFHIAGSYRRLKTEVGDIDIISLGKAEEVNERLKKAEAKREVLIKEMGPQKTQIEIEGEQVDIRFTDKAHLGTMLCYFTGSREFGIRLRSIAKEHGCKLTEYDLTDAMGVPHTFEDEKELFAELGLVYTAPFLRNGRGVVRKAKERRDDSCGSMMCGR